MSRLLLAAGVFFALAVVFLAATAALILGVVL